MGLIASTARLVLAAAVAQHLKRLRADGGSEALGPEATDGDDHTLCVQLDALDNRVDGMELRHAIRHSQAAAGQPAAAWLLVRRVDGSACDGRVDDHRLESLRQGERVALRTTDAREARVLVPIWRVGCLPLHDIPKLMQVAEAGCVAH